MMRRREIINSPAGRKSEPASAQTKAHRPPSQEELRSIRLREREATKGPWAVQERVIDDFVTDRSITTTWEDPTYKWPLSIVGMHQSERGFGTWIEPENAEFIARARSDVPRMLAMLDVFAHPKVYEVLLRFYKSGDCPTEDRQALEQALDASWSLMKSRLEP